VLEYQVYVLRDMIQGCYSWVIHTLLGWYLLRDMYSGYSFRLYALSLEIGDYLTALYLTKCVYNMDDWNVLTALYLSWKGVATCMCHVHPWAGAHT
jgi:hypothetical protein